MYCVASESMTMSGLIQYIYQNYLPSNIGIMLHVLICVFFPKFL